MEISFDPDKRDWTLEARGLDFADATKVFEGPELTLEDNRAEYGEPRFQAFGMLEERLVMVVWTPTESGRRVISLRKCNDREQARYGKRVGGSG